MSESQRKFQELYKTFHDHHIESMQVQLNTYLLFGLLQSDVILYQMSVDETKSILLPCVILHLNLSSHGMEEIKSESDMIVSTQTLDECTYIAHDYMIVLK